MDETIDDEISEAESEMRATVTIDKRLYRVRFRDETEDSVTIVIEHRDGGERARLEAGFRVGDLRIDGD